MVRKTKKLMTALLSAALIFSGVALPANTADAAGKLAISKTTLTLEKGASETLKIKNLQKGQTVTWKSNKTQIATVTKKGKVTGKNVGTAAITAKVTKKTTNKTFKCKVTVKEKLAISKTTLTLEKGASETLKIKNLQKGQTVTWKSNKTQIATVTKKGKVTGKNVGTAAITAKVTKSTTNKTFKCKVTVKEKVSPDEGKKVKIAYRFADRKEGVSLLLGNTEYYNGLNQNDMDYRAQKKGATLEDVKEFTTNQVLEFSGEEKKAIDDSISTIESILTENGYVLPQMDEIVFVRTTQLEEGGANAYTHKNEIYYGDDVMELLLSDDKAVRREGNVTMCHEIFHCLTRNNPQFRKDMYSIIHFTVQDKDFELGPEVAEISLSNPDVEHRDSYATFTINGEKKDCFMVLATTQPFQKEGDSFVQYVRAILVPVDDTNTYYPVFTAFGPEDPDLFKEFFGVVGTNTSYAIDPEEVMADNFSFAVVYGKDGIGGQPYGTPEIIDKIIDYLKK